MVAPSRPTAIPLKKNTSNLQRGRVMKKLSTLILRNSLLFFATLFIISSLQVMAQTTPQATASTKPVARITQAIDDKNLVQTGGIVHSLARPEFDRGVVADSQPMNRMLLQLQRSPAQETALRELLDEQQTRNSPNYHAWLTPAQFGQQFGVAADDVQKVTDWLTQKGFTGIKVSPSQLLIEFSGTAGLVRTAFHTEIHNFMVNGKAHMANVSRPQIPAALAPVVAGVVSLHNFRKTSFVQKSTAAARAKAEGRLKPGFTASPCGFEGPGTTCFGMGPADFAKIYNIPSSLKGTGQTIAIVARSNITVSDINQFGQGFGISNLTNFTAANNILLESADPGIVSGDDLEATLDVEASGGVAPNATILLVVADGTLSTTFSDGVDLSALYIISNNLAPVMSESFGSAEEDTFTPFYQDLWEQGAAQGITIALSTGDSGSASIDGDAGNLEAFNGVAVSGLASTPFNVAVGGTDFADGSNPTTYWSSTNGTGLLSAKSYIPEVPWNDSCAATATVGSLTTCANESPSDLGLDLAGGGGGQSGPCGTQDTTTGDCTGPVPKPSWQAGTGVPADGARDLPDVALFAADGSSSGNFWIVCHAGVAGDGFQNGEPCNLSTAPFNFVGIGGTSASTPAFAGIMALVNQSQAATNPTGRQGVANYVLYKLAQTAGASCNAALPATITNTSCIFYDITTGNNSVECAAQSPNCSNQTASGNGVLIEPTGTGIPFAANTPAWSATTGYDLATGLGSVNVANLTSKWNTIFGAFKTATTTITSPATGSVNITHGTDVNFTVTVTGSGGTPTGDVSLIAEPPGFPQFEVAGGTLANGTITFNTANGDVVNSLPGDTTTGAGTAYPVIAHYAGDGTFGPSNSAPINVTVNRENSSVLTTLYTEDPNTGNLTSSTSTGYGSPYIIRYDVLGSGNDNQVCANVVIPCPTGSITVTYDSGTKLNDFLSTATSGSTNVANLNVLGFVEDRQLGGTGLPGGTHSVLGAYSGDNSYNPSAGTAVSLTINPALTQTIVSANGAATTSVATGQSVTLVATVQGFNNIASTQQPSPKQVASNGAGPTGTVTFSPCGTATNCTVPVTPTAFTQANGDAYATGTLTTTFTTTGVQNVTATFTTGDKNYVSCLTAAPPACTLAPAAVTVTNTVGPAAKLAFSTQPSNVATGASISPAVQVSIEDANGNLVNTATSAVTIAISNNAGPGGVLSGTLTANAVAGVATFSNLSINKAGTGYTLQATDGALTAAISNSFNVTATVGPPAKLVFSGPPSNVAVGASITPAVAVTIQDASGNTVTTATNQVTIAITTGTGTGTLGGTLTVTPVNGVATFSNLTISAAGTGYTLTATSTGLTSAISNAFNVTAPGSFTVAATPNPVILNSSTGATVNATITITSVNGFNSPVTVVCPTSLPPGVTCTPPSAITPPANGSNTGMLGLAVTATSSSLTASNITQDQMLDAKTTPVIPGAKEWWALSAGTGFAAIFLIFLPGGRKRFRAALGLGLACLLSLSLGCSNNGTPVVTKTATTTKMTVNADKEPSGTAFTFSVTVTGGTPTGMVQLFDGTTAIGTAAAVAGGTATPTAPALSVGTHSISAHYIGDSTTAPSSSGSLNLTSTGSTTVAITTTPAATPVASPINITIQ